MNKYSVSKKPHFICKRLILSKISCFEVEASLLVYFKGIYSLSDLRLARNVSDLLDDANSLVGFCLVPESDESSDNVSDKSSEDDEDEESDKISIFFVLYGHVLVPLHVPLRIFHIFDLQEFSAPYSCKRSFGLFVFFFCLFLLP